MRNRHRRRSMLAILGATLLLSITAPSRGVPEPWSDPRLKLREGLVAWFDASRQPAAASSQNKPAPKDAQPVDAFFDASGNALHLSAPNPTARPRFLTAGEVAFLRFDGEGAHLFRANIAKSLSDTTIFIVAVPHSNHGDFRALLAFNQSAKNDYTTGLTIDQSFGTTTRFDTLNVEGAGFGGAVNLLTEASPFATLRTLTVTSQPGAAGVKLFLDGKPQGHRDRAPNSSLHMDQLVLGARCYSNEPRPPYIQGFFEGDIAEVLIYDRALSDADRRTVEQYLSAKYANITPPPPPRHIGEPGTRPLVTVTDPPPLQFFLPGFAVRQLPLKLPNINNIRYRPDGKLVALAYNGNVYLLTDTDGDGLEDHADLFWDNQGRLQAPIGMALTPPNYALGTGVFVANKRKVSLIIDRENHNGGNKADKEIVVAEGWEPLKHNVDALGVALDKDGAVYFGLGTTDFTNAYQIGQDGKSRYDLKSDRGTVQKVSPDFKHRETICTGIRFSVALGFNAAGDLFATDQEGATWLANGNPLDELLHIQPGRHYGFPPRHPKFLPNVIDEPSTFDYGPQHQSTCGLAFNVPATSSAGASIFGPALWANDAFVTGYSRGKLFRTKLIKTDPAGYVAQTQLLAAASMLVVDSCVTPSGDLLVAMHSGAPDWGSGPSGEGKLFKISYADRAHPQPVLAWAAGPREVRIAFDRPIDPALLRGFSNSGNITIEHGSAVSAGDRFETLRPGYAVVQRQLRAPRYDLPVLGVAMTPDNRTLILATAPQSNAADAYAVTLPSMGRPATSPKGFERQQPAIDLAYDLSGVEATWTPKNSTQPAWTGWLPHLDLAVANALTQSSADHDALRSATSSAGDLRLSTQLDLTDMLRPAVQPGSKIDYEWPAEHVTLTFASTADIAITAAAGKVISSDVQGRRKIEVTFDPKPGERLPLQVTLQHPGGAWPNLSVWYHTAEDPRPRTLQLRRMRVPWATARPEVARDAIPQSIPQLEGGSYTRGKAVFFSQDGQCFKCHRLAEHGGGQIGPDLSNLYQRDYESVLKDIVNPSAAINPDFVAYTITLNDGNVLAGVPREAPNQSLIIGEPGGAEKTIRRSDIRSMAALPTSIMPHGLDGILGPQRMKDLLTFLLAEPLTPAPIEAHGVPKPRTRAELQRIVPPTTASAANNKPLHILLAAGPKDHGPGEHDYPLWQRRWKRLLSTAENVEIQTAFAWPTADQFRFADVIVFYSDNPGFTAARAAELDAFLARGGGLIYIHFAVDGHDAPDALAARIGLAWRGGKSRFRHGALDLRITDPAHPITAGLQKLDLYDESYWDLIGDPANIHVLAEGTEDGAPRPLIWTREPKGGGRVLVSIPGHFTWTFDDPLFRAVILRGIAWCAGQPADRLIGLTTPGARIEP
jgi:putative heme-binding domain-containing protein